MRTMDEKSFERMDAMLRQAAQNFEYPPTPEIGVFLPVGANRRWRSQQGVRPQALRRWTWAAALVVVALLAALLSVPRVRAAVAEFIQIGVVRIFQQTPAVLPEVPAPLPTQISGPPPTASSAATEDLNLGRLVSAGELTGATTLEAARRTLPFPVRLPGYPPDLGEPDGVYLQNMDGFVLVLVWDDPDQPERPALSLHTIQAGSWTITKIEPKVVQETNVGGRPAVWAVGPYLMMLRNGNSELGRLVDGNVLIWEQDGLTYRLESDLLLEEAVKIAESLQ